MKLITLALSCFLLSICNNLSAQFARFPVSGVIEFEKKVNMYAAIKKVINKDNETYYGPMLEQYKKTQPQFKILKSTLSFSKDKTYYSPIAETENTSAVFSWIPISRHINTVFNDLSMNTSSVQKNVFDEIFLVKDTTRSIKWKITNETREIAGYSCRRANAIIMDSVYVVAFYTDQIPVSSGPETFSGLPGMILGVALPHENITWFATSVTDKPLDKPLVPPVKGKVVDNKSFQTTLKSVMKDWGVNSQPFIRAFVL
jgi:GLPGLI family protein